MLNYCCISLGNAFVEARLMRIVCTKSYYYFNISMAKKFNTSNLATGSYYTISAAAKLLAARGGGLLLFKPDTRSRALRIYISSEIRSNAYHYAGNPPVHHVSGKLVFISWLRGWIEPPMCYGAIYGLARSFTARLKEGHDDAADHKPRFI